eukprot:TRINITY_DN10790_c0_g1_i1.p1 TRINITY_DN10790_c0_g1~~TRINITY_DN10790_c0_g1_i1.p1  ORF type:complete len:101 (+),score=10.77 TRINITY_DN10790_c0_g1_i1:54-356(+)
MSESLSAMFPDLSMDAIHIAYLASNQNIETAFDIITRSGLVDTDSPFPEFSPGQRVLARWKGGRYYPGIISAMNIDGTAHIIFDDGDVETNEPLDHINPV